LFYDKEQRAMPDQQEKPSSPRPRIYKYTPWSTIAAPISLPIGLTLGKALGEAMEWGKGATVLAECSIGIIVAVVLLGLINFFFGKEVEITDKKSR
jgi:membrane protein DedA with SNARE-associated domain